MNGPKLTLAAVAALAAAGVARRRGSPAAGEDIVGDYLRDLRQNAEQAALAKAKTDLGELIGDSFSLEFPDWEVIDVEIKAEDYHHGSRLDEPNRRLRIVVEVRPRPSHPEYEWIWEAPGEQIVAWMKGHYMGDAYESYRTNNEDGPDLRVYLFLGSYAW